MQYARNYKKSYTRATKNDIILSYNSRESSFKNGSKVNSTKLNYIWERKDKNIDCN